jgi:hypothetical protein
MPNLGEKLGLTSGAITAKTALADIDYIRGAFKVYASSDLVGISPNYFSDKQIIYVKDSGSLYQADVVLADFITVFEDSVTFRAWSFDSGSFVSASYNEATAQLTFFGQDIENSTRVSMSVDLSQLTGSGGGGGGSGDITAVFAGDGLTGGASSGNATLEVDAGLGINLSGGVNVDTGSNHFVGGVQKVEIDGDTF